MAPHNPLMYNPFADHQNFTYRLAATAAPRQTTIIIKTPPLSFHGLQTVGICHFIFNDELEALTHNPCCRVFFFLLTCLSKHCLTPVVGKSSRFGNLPEKKTNILFITSDTAPWPVGCNCLLSNVVK